MWYNLDRYNATYKNIQSQYVTGLVLQFTNFLLQFVCKKNGKIPPFGSLRTSTLM